MTPILSNSMSPSDAQLTLQLDEESKNILVRAAELRQMSLSDYICHITIGQAREEVQAANNQTISMTAEEQLAFWTALNEPVALTPAQQRLSKLMRGET